MSPGREQSNALVTVIREFDLKRHNVEHVPKQ